jgi:hypothetical protein
MAYDQSIMSQIPVFRAGGYYTARDKALKNRLEMDAQRIQDEQNLRATGAQENADAEEARRATGFEQDQKLRADLMKQFEQPEPGSLPPPIQSAVKLPEIQNMPPQMVGINPALANLPPPLEKAVTPPLTDPFEIQMKAQEDALAQRERGLIGYAAKMDIAGLSKEKQEIAAARQGIKDQRAFQSKLGEYDRLSQDAAMDPAKMNALVTQIERENPNSVRAQKYIDNLKNKLPPSPLTGENQTFQQELSLRNSFMTQTKDFRDVRDAYGRIKTSGVNPSPAGDLALIFNYMKMLDPGSTVREGEFANAQNAGSVPERIRAYWNKALEGTRLDENQRADFLERAKNLYKQSLSQAKKTESETKNLARSYGLNADRVVTDIGIQDDFAESENPPGMSHEKAKRLKELREKRDAGTLK